MGAGLGASLLWQQKLRSVSRVKCVELIFALMRFLFSGLCLKGPLNLGSVNLLQYFFRGFSLWKLFLSFFYVYCFLLALQRVFGSFVLCWDLRAKIQVWFSGTFPSFVLI